MTRIPSLPRSRALVLAAVLALTLGAFGGVVGPSVAEQTATGEAVRAPDPIGVWEYVPPAPWVDPSTLDIANHSLTYSPQRTPQSNTPQAFDFRRGDIKVLVLLVEFSDVTHRAGNGQSYYNQFVNGNSSSDRSMRTYFFENSYGNYTVIGTVVDWVELPNTMAYYDGNTARLVGDSAAAANPYVDFSQFDLDGDRYVDNLVIIHAGGDQAVGCTPNCIWSHSGAGYRYSVDGVYVQAYCTLAEFGISRGDALGVLLHEFGHLGLNLPDLYDVEYDNAGLDDWDLMAGGAWDGGGWAPAHLSVWSKIDLDWEEAYEPPFNLEGYTIYPTSDINRHNPLKITTNYTNEYFLVEMRSKTASSRYDTGLPYSGLLIYHIDTNTIAQWRNSNRLMHDTNHKGVDIEEDGFQGIDENYYSNNAANDIWLSDATGFTPTSNPNSNLYVSAGNYVSGIKVFNISSVINTGGPHMTINIDTGRINFDLVARVLGGAEREALPGASATYRVEVTTLAASGDTVSVEVQGAHTSLGSVDRTVLNLPAFGSDTVNLTVGIPSNWGARDPAYVSVRLTSLAPGATATALVPTLTRTGQVFSISIAGSLDATDVVPGINRTISLDVRNLGNGMDNVTASPVFSLAELSMVVPTAPTGEAHFYLQRGQATSLTITYNVLARVLADTVLPVTLDLRYGPASSPLHTFAYGNVTVGKRAVIEVEAQVGPLTYLVPGEPKAIPLAIHNYGNYFATIDLTAVAPPGVIVIFDVPSVPVAAFNTVNLSAVVTADTDVPAWTTGDMFIAGFTTDGLATHTATIPIEVAQRFDVLLSGETTGTGAPGTSVSFALVATNFGNGQDATRLTVTPSFSEWNATLSQADFTLTQTGSTKSANFLFTATVPEGAGGNTVQVFVLTLLSQQAGSNSSLVLSVVVTPIYSFEVSSSAAQEGVKPSETASFLISFKNTGNVRDTYSITVAGLPEAWDAAFAEGSGLLPVGPGFTGALTLLLKPPESAQAGSYDFQIFATSEGDLVRRKILLEAISVFSHREIAVRVSNVVGEVRPGALVAVYLVVENRGNVQEQVYLTATGAFGDVTFDPFQVTVGAYQEVTATALVLIESVPAGGYGALIITATSVADADVSSEGTVGITVTSPPPSQVPGLEAAVATVALAAAALVGVVSRRRSYGKL